jgi:phage anti-repressor protein
MMDEDTTDWDEFFSDNPNASSFEGTSPSADGYSAIGPSGGTYVTDVNVLGSKSIKFHVEGASSNCPVGNLMNYNAINPEGGDTGDLYYRVYARWNTEDDSWPTSHIKMIDCQGSGAQYYFQPANGSSRPTHMNAAYDGSNHNYAIPSGQLENDRWYAMEVRWKSTSPYAFDAWVDGTQIADDSPNNPGSLNYLLFGIINCCGTTSNFSLDHWMDGLAVSTSRIYPAAIVEIGDSSNYSTATKVYQEPIFISDSSTEVKVDLTDLGSGPYYLWVTNNKQERSSYYELQTDLATNPSPANSATDVDVDANLSWTAGSGATSHDVYFGTDSTPDSGEFQGNQTAVTFEPGTMSNSTTYYWRIDEVDSGGTTTGNVWNFTTESGASPPGQATNPSPANSATSVSITADLSWTAGSGATSRDVYFGTSSPGTSQGNQTATTFDTGTMSNNTTYYWRIDEVNAAGTTTGTVWSFTTIVAAPGQASSPSPSNSATGVSITADLSWSAGSGATSHDVYFGTSSPGTSQGNQTATTFDTGTMSNNTTYYWRIDEVNAGGTTTGSVWSFTTIVAAPGQATNPSPADSAANVAVDTDLSWTAGSGATSHDVYFGTSSPGSFQGNQTAATFDTGSMDNDTTYYWRIDEVNAATTTTGNVWSFTTITSGQPVTVEFGDAVDTNYPGTIEDTYTNVGEGGSVNYSTIVTLNTYTWPADTIANTTIIKWDLSAIPNDATVTEATLYLYQVETGGDTSYDIGVHKIVNVDPNITTCTWNTYDGTNSWTGGADGGQGDTATAEDTQSVNSTNSEYKTWSVTNMIQAWVSTPSSNYGMLVNSDDVASVDSYRTFASTEDSNTPYRPKLIVTYIAGTPAQATNPDPNDSATDVTVDAVLSWTAGSGATSHDVYFGTSSPGSFQGNQTSTTFDPGTLSYDITYYWRIDEINAAGTTTGNVWTFTTEAEPQPPGQATNPSPADSATNVDVDADLSWTEGTGSTSSDVYFGTSSPGTFQGNQTATTFEPGTMSNDTTYYWRIDEINTGGTTTGTVWSFTTIVAAPSQATNPSPANSATDVDIDTDLSWTAGSGSTSSDVYFGTTSPGTFQGNQTATTFEPGTMSNDTTYYWRIDEINAGGTTTGSVWSFTTIVAAPGQASNPSPADSATNVNIDADLSWTAGSGSTSSDVYFGTTSPGTFQGNQTATTFEPGTMANGTTYYWRIDEVNAGGTTTGNVWSFTTIVAAPGQASSPSPADSATNVDIDADLSWTAGSGSTSSDVYFGTTSPGTFQGNQTSTTFEPGTMSNDTTYYWRIDEINAAGTTTGNVWSFTTETAAGPVTEEFGDATNTDYPGTIDDTWTNVGGATTNYSTSTRLNTYTWPVNTVANTIIIKWDLTDISTSATVTEATLYLYQVDSGGDTSYDIGVHKIVNVDPNITTCTWNTYDGTNSWTGGSDGGQGDTATAEDTQSVNSTNNEYKTWTVTNMAQAWVSTPANNYGMLVNSDDVASVDSFRYFASTEDSNTPYRPKLIVSYTTAAPGQASSPSPANSATDVSIDADLSWTAGSGATSHDVYFGTSSPGSFQGNQTATTFEPGTMSNDTTYYWRIDEVNAAGTTTGNVWSFTTVTASSDVEIIGSWVSGTSHTEESGSDRLLVFTAHVEDNDTDMNVTSVTYGGQSMTKVVEQNVGSGYRAYVVAYVLDEDGIDAASGSSFVVTWAQTPSRSPGFSSVFLQNVNQTTPTAASDGNGTESSSTVATDALSTSDGDMVFVAGTCGNSGTYSVNNSFTEGIELSISSADAVAGYKAATGANETPSITHSNVNRQVVIGFVVQAE